MDNYDVRQMRGAALVIALAANLTATVTGMQAENQQRIHKGESLAYTEEAFQNVLKDSGIWGWNQIIHLLNGD